MLAVIVPRESGATLNNHKPDTKASYGSYIVRIYDRRRLSELPMQNQRLDCCLDAPSKVESFPTINEATVFISWFYGLSFDEKVSFLDYQIFYKDGKTHPGL